jgi:Lipopolysaccharide export system permease LptF/LptG
MKTVRRLLYRDIVASVLFVALAFLSLFFFGDLVNELEDVGRQGRTVGHAVIAALLELPGNLYVLAPIAVLIGTIYSLARLAQTSEFTILRTGGLGPGRALKLLAQLGLVFGAVTFIVGDYVAPAAQRASVALKARFSGGIAIGGAGAWLKEKRSTPQGEHSFSVNIAGTGPGGSLLGVRIFEFDRDGRLVSRTEAREGRVDGAGRWQLADAETTVWPAARDAANTPVKVERHSALTDEHPGALALQHAPVGPGTGLAGSRDPLLAQGAVPAGLPGDGGAGAALRLSSCTGRWCQPEGVRRHHARHQLRAAEQPRRPHRQPAGLDPLAGRRHAEPAVPAVVDGGLHLAGALPLSTCSPD